MNALKATSEESSYRYCVILPRKRPSTRVYNSIHPCGGLKTSLHTHCAMLYTKVSFKCHISRFSSFHGRCSALWIAHGILHTDRANSLQFSSILWTWSTSQHWSELIFNWLSFLKRLLFLYQLLYNIWTQLIMLILAPLGQKLVDYSLQTRS